MNRIRRGPGQVIVVATFLGALAGCATAPAGRPPGPAAAASRPGVAGPATPAPAGARSTAVADTTPSSDALAVLGTIPEPVSGGRGVLPGVSTPAPATPPAEAASPATPTAGDSGARSDSAAPPDRPSDVPVPAPTPVLGERATPDVVPPPDTLGAAARALAGAPAVKRAPAPPPAALAARADTCWRLQIGAPAERARAERYRAAGSSQLLVPFVIEREKGLYRVRSRDCLTREASDALKRRALDAGFSGAFRFREVK